MNKLVCVTLLLLAAACSKGKVQTANPPAVTTNESTGATAAEAEKPAEPNHFEEILKRPTLAEAFNYAKPYMSDTHDTTSAGANLFAYWAAKKGLSWSDLNSLGDTKFALVKKDSEIYRGQKICRGGRVIQISVDRFEDTKFYRGLLITNDGDIADFIAIKSSGDLVERSWAKFCGVVIGNLDYSNSGGGTSHAVQLVGMFDLPENRL